MKKRIVFGVCFLILMFQTLAYIDPGTGGMIAGSVWPFVIGILAAIGGFFVRYLFKPVKGFVRKIWKKG